MVIEVELADDCPQRDNEDVPSQYLSHGRR